MSRPSASPMVFPDSVRPMNSSDATRTVLIGVGIRLLWITIGLNAAAGGTAVVVGLLSGSPALGGFGVNAAIDTAVSSVLVWRFRTERRDRAAADQLERRVLRATGFALFVFAVSVGAGSVETLASRSRPGASALGIATAAVSVAILPFLARRKIRTARLLESAAFRADGVLTAVSGALAGVTLTGLVLNRTLGWWWADPVAALVIASVLLRESWSALRD